jgi:hypothetical protein
MGSSYVAKIGLELSILLPQPPKCESSALYEYTLKPSKLRVKMAKYVAKAHSKLKIVQKWNAAFLINRLLLNPKLFWVTPQKAFV